jgi:hypothetical protein
MSKIHAAGVRYTGLAVVALLASLFIASGPASAKPIASAIKSVNTTITVSGTMTTTETFCVPDGTQQGDTFTQTLPIQQRGFAPGFAITDPAGDVIANVTISTTRPAVATFTMTAFASTHQDVCGSAYFSSLSSSSAYNGTTQTLTFTDNDGSTFTNVVTFPTTKVINHALAAKEGYFTTSDECRTTTSDCLRWGIDSPLGPLTGGTLADNALNGQLFDCSSTPPRMLIGVPNTVNGAFSGGTAFSTGVVITCSPNRITASFGAVPAGKILQLSFFSSAPAAGGPSGGVSYHDNASVISTANGVTTTTAVSASVLSAKAGGSANGIQTPSVTITKWDTADGPAAGAFDTAPGKPLAANTPTPITMTITNSGTEPLIDVVVSDVTSAGPVLTGLSCDFAPLGGPASGVSWAGPFAVGASFACTGTVPAMAPGVQETDTATVAAAGQTDRTPVTSSNAWNGVTLTPAVTILKGDALGNAADTVATAADLGPQPASVGLIYTVTNFGTDALKNVTVTDQVLANGTVTGLSCDFSPLGGPATGTTWAGPLAAGASFTCTAQLSGVLSGAEHEDVGTVSGTGVSSGVPVTSANAYYASATPAIVTAPGGGQAATPPAGTPTSPTTPTIVTKTLASTGFDSRSLLGLAVTLLAGGLVLIGFGRRRRPDAS